MRSICLEKRQRITLFADFCWREESQEELCVEMNENNVRFLLFTAAQKILNITRASDSIKLKISSGYVTRIRAIRSYDYSSDGEHRLRIKCVSFAQP